MRGRDSRCPAASCVAPKSPVVVSDRCAQSSAESATSTRPLGVEYATDRSRARRLTCKPRGCAAFLYAKFSDELCTEGLDVGHGLGKVDRAARVESSRPALVTPGAAARCTLRDTLDTANETLHRLEHTLNTTAKW